MLGTVTDTGAAAGTGRARDGTFTAGAGAAVVLFAGEGEGDAGTAGDSAADGMLAVGAEDGAAVPHPLRTIAKKNRAAAA
ncbi:hypothetical protein ACFVTE_09160 [Arthrobacter sp. NPDC058097]|uniref:hypothetical protein n=1 Tax=Arthrobacter sp. NPDC058097 TaxID=3346340 RepID=UPI0036DC8ADC